MNRGVVGVVRRTTDGQAMLVYAQKCKKKVSSSSSSENRKSKHIFSACLLLFFGELQHTFSHDFSTRRDSTQKIVIKGGLSCQL